MEETKKVVEGAQGATTEEVDYAAEYEKLLAENVKIASDRDNYRTGLLKAKGKIPNDDEGELEERIAARVEEKFLSAKQAEIEAKKDEIVKNLARKNKELTLALKNNSKSSTGMTVGTEGQAVHTSSLSPEQLANLKGRGWDDKKIKAFEQNLKKRA